MVEWQSGASIATLQLRAKLLAMTREFFAKKGVLEVETPVLSRYTTSDVYLNPISTSAFNSRIYYLQTSPEVAMKRLLGMGIGPIYQICKAFRDDQPTSKHNPEFTLLEWYRPSFSMTQLIDEVEEFLSGTIGCREIPRYTYLEVFKSETGLNPHKCSLKELGKVARSLTDIASTGLSFSEYLDLLMTVVIEPNLPEYCFLIDYPECQAAMAKIEVDENGNQIAKRFELYCKGLEIANGYFELTDPVEQLKRLNSDNVERLKKELPEMPIDENFLAALSNGIPEGSGVALGLDRLLMIMGELEHIDSVQSFSISRV